MGREEREKDRERAREGEGETGFAREMEVYFIICCL